MRRKYLSKKNNLLAEDKFMIYIVLDTNVLHNDWNLTGTRLTLLTESAQKLNHQICIPMVVEDELVNQYQTEIQDKADAYNKADGQGDCLFRWWLLPFLPSVVRKERNGK